MEIKQIERITYKNVYVANAGTEFSDEAECKKYEDTAICVINAMFQKIPHETNNSFCEYKDMFSSFSCDDNMFAVKIRNADDVEVVNKWIMSHGNCNSIIGPETIGTIQLFDVYDSCSVWNIGTPEQLKEKYSKAVDSLYSTLIEKSEEKNANAEY